MAALRPDAPDARAAFYCIGATLLIQAFPLVAQQMNHRLGPPRAQELVQLGADVFRQDLAGVSRNESRADLRRVALPDAWREATGRRRSPSSLLVFVDGDPVPFQYREAQEWAPDRGPTVAYYVSPRTGRLIVRCGPATACREALVVRDEAPLRLRLVARRLLERPAWSLAFAGAALLCAALSGVGARAWPLGLARAASLGLLALIAWRVLFAEREAASVWLLAQALLLVSPPLVRGARAATSTLRRAALRADTRLGSRLARLGLVTAAAFAAALPHIWLNRYWSPGDLDDSFLYLFASSRLLATGSLLEGLSSRDSWVYSGYPVVVAAAARVTGSHPMAVYRAASDAGAVLLPLALGILAWSLSGRFATGIAAAWIGGLWGGLAGYAWLLSDAIPALLGGRPPPMLETDYYEPRFLGEYVGPHSEITAYLNGPAFYPRDMGLVPSWLALAVLMAPLRNRWRLLGVLLLGGAATAIYPYYGSSALILFAAAGAGAAGNLDPRRRRLAAAAAAVGLVLAALALVVLADTFISNYLEPAGLRAYLAGLAGGSTTVPTAPVLEFQLARVASGHFFMICAIGWMVWTRQADAAQPLWQRRWLRRLFVFGIAAAGASGLAASLDATAWRVLSVYRWVVPWRTLVEPLLVVLTALAVERLVTRLWSRSRRAAAIALLAAPCFSPLHWNANAWRFWESGIRGGNTRERLAKYEEFADAGARVLGRTRFREPLLLEGASVATGDYVQAALGVTTVNNRSRALVPEGQPRLLHLLAPHAEPALRAASASGQIGDVMAATDGELARRLRASPDWCEVAGFGRFVVLRPTSVCAP